MGNFNVFTTVHLLMHIVCVCVYVVHTMYLHVPGRMQKPGIIAYIAISARKRQETTIEYNDHANHFIRSYTKVYLWNSIFRRIVILFDSMVMPWSEQKRTVTKLSSLFFYFFSIQNKLNEFQNKSAAHRRTLKRCRCGNTSLTR